MKMFGDVTKGLKRQKRALARQLKQIDGVLTKLAKIEGKKATARRRVSARKAKTAKAEKRAAKMAKAKPDPVKVKIDSDLEAKRRRAAALKRSDNGE